MSNFAFLSTDFPAVAGAAASAERLAGVGEGADPTLAAVSAGRAAELAVKWAYANDDALSPPYQSTVSTLIHERAFRELCGQAVFEKLRYVNRVRNRAAHEDRGVPASVAQGAVRELFHVLYWFARAYAADKPDGGLAFDASVFTRRAELMAAAATHIKAQREEIEKRDAEIERLREAAARGPALDEEHAAARREVAKARAAAQAPPDPHDYDEAATRDRFIDVLLAEAGWTDLRADRDLEVRVEPMPNERGHGFADYVLWGDDGLPLAVIEAKRTRVDPRVGQQQAKLYADALEAMHGRRPIIFTTNGYEHWIWDDAPRENGTGRPPRTLGGFYKRAELEAMIARRGSAKPLSSVLPRPDIAGRPYQLKALGRIAEDFDAGRHKALLVMATGTGKTRTVVSLVDAMMRAGLVKRTLFLADRVSLVRQAVSAFKAHLPASNPVNLVTERDGQGRVYVSTYPTMMGLIDKEGTEGRVFGPGHFDLVVIDEAHRSVYNRFGAIFDYFGGYLVGLTATPRDEVARDTYRLFDLEPGVPTDAYGLEEAIAGGYLVPPEPISVPTKFTRTGIRYDDLPQDEKDEWDQLEWEDGEVPDEVSAEALNRFLFNADTVDKILAHVMTNGIRVAGGDRLAKTILFAKNQAHAEFIEARFNAGWPHLAGRFARVITYKGTYAQSLIDDFSQAEKDPHLAISVDMLDTGIDVPEVANLVFFKLVRSKTKFWQMIGRGTRLRPDLFGPGRDKATFRVFDVCGNLEFFGQDPATKEAAPSRSLTERLFDARLAVVRTLEGERTDGGGFGEDGEGYDAGPDAAPSPEAIVRDLRAELRAHVGAMSLDSFVVRTQRRLVEKYQDDGAWRTLDDEAAEELSAIAGLPTGRAGEDEAAKRFDLLMFSLQLALLRGEGQFERLKRQLKEIASALEAKAEVPAVKRHLTLIEAIQTEAWWEGVTASLLELARRRLRDVAGLADRGGRKVIYTDFEDDLGEAVTVALPGTAVIDEQSFRRKVRDFLRRHEDTVALQKLRRGLALTATDLEGLEAMLVEAGVANHDDLERAAGAAEGLGAFLRSLVGLDEDAARAAFAEFVGPEASRDQIEFIEMIVSHLTQNGQMTPGALYESPFKEVAPQGPEDVFPDGAVVRLHEVIRTVGSARKGAAATGRA